MHGLRIRGLGAVFFSVHTLQERIRQRLPHATPYFPLYRGAEKSRLGVFRVSLAGSAGIYRGLA